MSDFPRWRTPEALSLGDNDIVECDNGVRNHIATVAAFKGCGGCPYCNRTADERDRFLRQQKQNVRDARIGGRRKTD